MSATKSAPTAVPIYRFGPFEADVARDELRKYGIRIRLERKPWLLLLALLAEPGSVVPRGELQGLLWDNAVFVDFETGLNVAVNKVRAALNDSSDSPTYIETIAGEGYRFVASVVQAPSTAPDSATSLLLSTPPDTNFPRTPFPANTGRQSWSWTRRAPTAAAGVVILISASVVIMAKPDWLKLLYPSPQPGRKIMLVVLPFQNLSNDPSQDYFGDGMTEELSTQLGNANPSQLGVIGRTSAMTYKHSERTIRQIGQELAVDYVLEGSVRRDGDQVRVTAQLVQVSDQAHVWAATYDESLRDLLPSESNLAREIAGQVGVAIVVDQAKTPAHLHIPNTHAHDAYMRGRYYWYQRTTESWKTAEEYFRLAILKDSEYSAAYAGLAECRIPKNQAQAAALKAISLDPTSGEAYAALAWVQFYWSLDPTAAGPAFRRAIELAPNYAQAHYSYGAYLRPPVIPMRLSMRSRKPSCSIHCLPYSTPVCLTFSPMSDDSTMPLSK